MLKTRYQLTDTRPTQRHKSASSPALPIAVALICIASIALSHVFDRTAAVDLVVWGASFAIVAWLAFRTGPTGDILNPYFLLIGLYALYSWSAAGYALTEMADYFDSGTMRSYYAAVLLGLVGFVAGFQLVTRHGPSRVLSHWSIERNFFDRRFTWALGAAALVSIGVAAMAGAITVFDFRTVQAYTDVATSWRLDLRDDSGGGVRAFLSRLPATYIISLATLLACRPGSLGVRAAAIAVLSYLLAIEVMRGEKAPMLSVSLFVVMYWHYRRSKSRPVHFVVPILVLYIFAVTISHVRNTTDLREMVRNAVKLIIDEPALLLPIYAGELNGPPQTLMVVINDIHQDGARRLGFRHYVDELRVWLPRTLDPNRPRPVSEQYMERFFRLDDAQGRGHGMFILTPGYWAFGPSGVLVETMLYGILVAFIYGAFRATVPSDALILVYSQCLFVLIFMCVRTGLLGTLRATLMATMPFVPILLLAYWRVSNKKVAAQMRPGPVDWLQTAAMQGTYRSRQTLRR